MFSFSTLSHDEPYHLLDTIAFQCIRICSRFCAFPVREKVEISSINAYAYLWGKYSPSTDSAFSRLTDLGIYDITRCGILLLTIFHIPYIHFQRELRKVTSPKWYLSFFVQYMYILVNSLTKMLIVLILYSDKKLNPAFRQRSLG